MEQTERIKQMELCLDEATAAVADLSAALDRYSQAQEAIKALAAYYGSDVWKADFHADEQGLLPADLKRGVLSEDGIYDVLSGHYALTIRLLDIVSSILKNR